MADMRRFGLIDLLMLLVVLGAAAGVRAGYLVTCADSGHQAGPLRVQETPRPEDQDVLVGNVRAGFRFASQAPLAGDEETTAHVAPGYPYLLGLLAQQIPAEKFEFTVRWTQVGLGTFAAACYFLFARRAFRSLLVGTLAGLLAALHPFWVVEVANLSDATLASTALALTLVLASQAGEKGGALKSLLFGGSLAGLALVRAAFLPFSFLLLVWFLLRSRTLRHGWLCALCAFLGFGAAISPWTIRNYQEFNEPVPVVSSTYLNLWIGNNPQATGGPATEEMWKNALPQDATKQSQPARYAQLGRHVAEEMRTQPVKTLQRRIQAAFYFLLGARWFADGTVVEETGSADELPDWLARTYPVTFPAVLLGLLVLSFLGWRWTYGWRYESIPAALAIMWVPLPYILGHAGAMSGARLPLDGVLLCYAAFTVCCFVPGLGGYLLQGATVVPASQASVEASSENPAI
ncbi:MAG: hypothetical protein U0840_19635 [Gemmataceae bacterium]